MNYAEEVCFFKLILQHASHGFLQIVQPVIPSHGETGVEDEDDVLGTGIVVRTEPVYEVSTHHLDLVVDALHGVQDVQTLCQSSCVGGFVDNFSLGLFFLSDLNVSPGGDIVTTCGRVFQRNTPRGQTLGNSLSGSVIRAPGLGQVRHNN